MSQSTKCVFSRPLELQPTWIKSISLIRTERRRLPTPCGRPVAWHQRCEFHPAKSTSVLYHRRRQDTLWSHISECTDKTPPVRTVSIATPCQIELSSTIRFCGQLASWQSSRKLVFVGLELPTDFKNLPGQLFGEKLSRLNHL